MWPTLISLGPVSIHTFGVVLFLGLFLGGFSLWRRSKEEGWEEAAVMDTWLTAGVAALVVGRLGFIALNWQLFGASWYKMLFLTKFPGLSAGFAWLGAVAALAVIALIRRFNFWLFVEAAVPALLLVETAVWLGNWFGGSGEARVQLIGASASALIYLLLNYWEKIYRNFGWAKPGFVLAAYLILVGGLKLVLRYWWWGGLTVLTGVLIFFVRSGINLPVPKLKANRKKRGFDYV